MTEYTTYEPDYELFAREERERIEKLRAKSKAFIESCDAKHAPVVGGLYRTLKNSTYLPQGGIVMVTSENHYISETYTSTSGEILPTELPEFRELYILVEEKVWPLNGPVESWYHWFERVDL